MSRTIVSPELRSPRGPVSRASQGRSKRALGAFAFLPLLGACSCDEQLAKLSPMLSVVEPAAQDAVYRIDFGTVHVGTTVARNITLADRGSIAGTITRLELSRASDPSFAVTEHAPLRVEVNAMRSIAVTVTPPNAGELAGEVDLDTDDPALAHVIVLLRARGDDAPEMPPIPEVCDLDLAPRTGDFGSIPAAGFQELRFLGTNRGGKDCAITALAIEDDPGQEIGILEAPATPATIAPGASFDVQLRWVPDGTIGLLQASLRIDSDDPAEPELRIPLTGRSTRGEGCALRFVPKPIDFGVVGIGGAVTQRVAVWNFGPEACDIFPPRTLPGSDPAFSIRFTDPASVGRALTLTKFDVDLSFSPATTGLHTGTGLIQGGATFFGAVTSSDTVALAGIGGDARVCLVPEELDFGTVAIGDRADRSFDITSCGASGLSARGVMIGSGSAPDFALDPAPILPVDIPAGGAATMTVVFAPQSDAPAAGTVDVLTNDRMRPRATVRLRANVSARCAQILTCSPAALGLPHTVIGQSSATSFTCVNAGTHDLTVSAISSSAAVYSVSGPGLPLLLHPGDSFRAQVEYSPAAPQNDSGAIDISSDACISPEILLPISGTGIMPDYPACTPPRTFQPAVRWQWQRPAIEPDYDKVTSTPIVVHLADTNGDGFINEDDTPDLVFQSFSAGAGTGPGVLLPSILRAISGDTGADLWSVPDPAQRVHWGVQIAAADLDGDGIVEIVAPLAYQTSPTDQMQHGKYRTGRLLCFEHTGKLKWMSDWWHRTEADTDDFSAPAIADLDGDGVPEIVLGASVFDANGHLLWEGARGIGTAGFGPLSVIADLDGDGRAEVIGGNTAYRADGTILWRYLFPPVLDVDGHAIVIDEDGDGAPEVVLRTRVDELVVLNGADGTLEHGPIHLDPTSGCPAPITAADFDGDGLPELAIPAGNTLHLIKPDGRELWQRPINDYSGQCGAAGASAFDFEGDGQFEVLYADATDTYIFRGATGEVIYDAPRESETLYETPIVADVDHDGHADVIVTEWGAPGLELLSNVGNDWVGTRPIWNQHSYHVTNVGPSGEVPRSEGAGWTRFNAWRANEPLCTR